MVSDHQAQTERAERLEYLRTITDRVMQLWPAESRPDTATDHPELVTAMEELNDEINAGHGATIARLLVENVAYRVLVDQELTELPPGCHLKIAFACGTTEYFASQALSWVASCALGRSDYLFASLMTSFKGEWLVSTIQALCDLGSALREGLAQVTLTPIEDGEAVEELPTTTAVGE